MDSTCKVSAEEFKQTLCTAIEAMGFSLLMEMPYEVTVVARMPNSSWKGRFVPATPCGHRYEITAKSEMD